MSTSSFWRKPPPSSRVLFKPPIAVSTYFYIFCVAFLGFFGTVIVRGTIKGGLGGGVFVFVFLFICPVAVMLFTSHRVGVRTEGRTLVISGYFRTTRIDVDEIQDVDAVLHAE